MGIPLREGQVKNLSELAIRNRAGETLPAVFEKRTAWPDGSAQWVWADFQGRMDSEYALEIRSGRATPLPSPGVTVNTSGDAVVVNNGVMEIKWHKQYAAPVEVSLISPRGRTVVATGDGKGVYLIDQKNVRAVLGGPESELQFTVETSNKLRAVLRVEGWYVADEKLARGIVWYDIRWQQPWMKVDHVFIVTRDNDEVAYKEIGATFPFRPAANLEAQFGVKDSPAVAMTTDADAYIFQDKYPLYDKKESHYATRLSEGREAAGWAELTDGANCLWLAVKDFAPQFPKELAATRGGLTAKLWSGRDGRVLDYRPDTLAKDWWGKWLERLDYSRDQILHKKTMEKTGKRDPRYYTQEQIRQLNPSCVGVARTHSMLVAWLPGQPVPARAERLHALLERPASVQPDPRWMMHVDPRIVTPMIARGEGGPEYDIVERGISAWLDELKVAQTVFPYTGWYEWGKHSNLLYEKAQDGTIYAQWYRLTSTNPYHYNFNMMLTWMRTGERKYLDEAERVNRWLADNEFIHWGGGREKRLKGFMFVGNGRAPVYWEGPGTLRAASTEATTAFAYEYFLCDTRRFHPIFNDLTEAYVHHLRNAYHETADATLVRMAGLYRVNQDKRLLETMRGYVRAWTDPNAKTGLRDSFWKGEKDQLYKAHRKIFMLLQYYDLTQDEYVVPIISKLAPHMFERYGPEYTQPFYYQHRFGAIGGRIYQRTHDPDMLFWARQQVAGAAEVFQRFEELPAERKGVERVLALKPTSSVRSPYVFDGVKFQADWMPGKGMLMFSLDGTPGIISLPIAIWALKGYPELE